MRAEFLYKGIVTVIYVQSESRPDGSVGPPAATTTKLKSCPYSPASTLRLELERVDPETETAHYRVVADK